MAAYIGVADIPAILTAMQKFEVDSVDGENRSEICGGRRMEGLLQALDSDNEAGQFFFKELQKYGHQVNPF